MKEGSLNFSLTSAGVELTGMATAPEELAAFIAVLGQVLEVFEKIAAIRIEAAKVDETAKQAQPEARAGARRASPTLPAGHLTKGEGE